MSVKILINKSQNNKAIKAGSILLWNEDMNDFVPTDLKFAISGSVVYGNSVYPNGYKLTLYVSAPFLSLSNSFPQTRVPYGSQYERKY